MNKKFITSGFLIVLMVLMGAASPFPLPNKALATTATYTTSGSWVAPAGVTSVQVEVWGGGGAGGGQNLASDGGGGGGGGAYSKLNTYTVVPGNSYSYTVGSGGTGVASATGNAGGDSYFINTSTLLAKGGSGGSPSTGTPPAGGAGGASASGVGDVKFSGGQGEKGRDNNTGLGGYGGSSGGTAANGYSGPQTYSTNVYPSASTPTGAGDGGDGGAANANGSAPASGNGGGGGGAGEGTAKVGGAGAVGKIVFTYTAPTTTLGDGTDSSTSVKIGPGASATEMERFSLSTDSGTDTVTGLTVTITWTNAYQLISAIGIYDTSNVLKCSNSSLTSNTVAITGCSIAVTTTPTEYVVKVTPLSHANMPAVPGTSAYSYANVSSITATNVTAGSDTGNAQIEIDNTSPNQVTKPGVGTNNTYNSIGWVNPTDTDVLTSGTILVLRSTSAVVATPVEGTSYSVGNTIGASTVVCVVAGSPPATSCQDTSLSNGTAYHYKIFVKDSYGNYNSGIVPNGSPATPTSSLKSIVITSGTSYVLPDDFDITNNTIWVIGGGGGGGAGNGGASQAKPAGGAGGGGASALYTNFSSANPGDTVTIAIGAAGTAGAYPQGDGGAGGDTTFFNALILKAAGGSAGLGAGASAPGAGGAGGLVVNSEGTTKYAGGTGGTGGDSGTSPGGGGAGGGAGGDTSAGSNGGTGNTDGGVCVTGGRGGGAKGGLGSSGNQGAGGYGTTTIDSELGTIAGAGGGGGDCNGNGTGGMYGAGGAGGSGGPSGGQSGYNGSAGQQGVIIITYAPIAAAAPTVTTQSASSITQTSATLNGTITARNASNSTVRGFAYGTDATLGTVIATTTENGSFGTGAFTVSASSLTCNVTYYFRPYATNTTGTGYGTIVSFTASPCAPTVTTQSATSVGQYAATLNGNITSTGGASATVRGFAWGTSSAMSGDTATTTENGTFGTGAFTNSSITFACNTTYYSRAYATNSGGTSYGAISASFTTTACPPPSTFNQTNFRFFASSSPDGLTFTQSTVVGTSWYGVTYGNGLFVSVSGSGSGNQVMTSPDGVNWTRQSHPENNVWLDIAYGNGIFVATSQGGTNRVMTSPDGINWTARSVPARSWRSITYGNGLFVAVADDTSTNGVMTSPDGITWTQQTVAQTFTKWGVTYGNGLYVVAGGGATGSAINQIMTSTNGATWNTQTVPSGAWFDVTYGNGTYVAVGTSGSVVTSTDGSTWNPQTSSSAQTFRGIAYGNGRFVAVADTGDTTNHIMTSTDGASWSNVTGPNIQLNSIVYGNGMFVIVSSSAQVSTSGSTLGMPLANENTAATLSATGDAFKLRQLLDISSSDATSNTKLFKLQYSQKSGTCDTSFSGETYRDIDYSTPISFDSSFDKLDGQFLVQSTTTDPNSGVNIRKQTYDTMDLFTNASTTIANGEAGMWEFVLKDNGATEGTSYCIRAIKTATSTSATTWTSRTSPVANAWSDIAYGNGLFVAIASNGTTANGIMTSPDGITWTSRTTPTANNWASVTYGNGLFVAVAYNGTTADDVMRSSDGITWTSSGLNGVPTANTWQSVTYGNGLFVAVGNGGTTANDVMTSPDGITWTPRTIPAAIGWLSVTYGNGLFVAIAWNGTTANNIMTSPDGITWTSRTSPVVNQWQDATYGNGLFVTVASYSGSGNRVMTSPDGITWTTRTSAADNDWLGVTYGNGLFVAVATDLYGTAGGQIMTSPNGITWTSRTSAAANQWQSVTYGNGLFVAVAADGTTADDIMTASTTDTLLDTYTYIPEIISATQAVALTQSHYRWRNDYGTESSASYAAAEDTAITSGVEIGDRVRLRFLIKDTAGSASNYVYRLEVASSSCSTWIAMPTSSSSGAPHWIMDTTSRVADGSATTDSAGLTNPTGTFTSGYFTSQSNSSPSLSLTSGQFTELEYSLRSTQNISLGTVYCFRLTNAGVATGFTYSHQPQITVLARNGVSRQSGGSGNAGNEANGTGPIIPGGGAGGGGGTETGGGGQGTGGGGSGGGGGGDTGYLLLPRFFQLAKNLFIITNDEFSFGYILKLR